jgi:thiol-disulfide isomerase/thioredoxin
MKKLLLILLISLFGCSQSDIKLKISTAENLYKQVAIHKGKEAVLINFWATWCAPCVEEFPMIVELSDKYEGKGLKVYYFSADWSDRKDAVIKFLVDHGVKGLSFMKVDGNDNQFIRDIHEKWTGALPFTIVFDKNGNISDYWEMMKSKDHFELAIKKSIKL